MTEMFAGYLCSTQIGDWIKVGDAEGWLYEIRYRRDQTTVLIVIHQPDGARTDGGCKKRVHIRRLDPRDVVLAEHPTDASSSAS